MPWSRERGRDRVRERGERGRCARGAAALVVVVVLGGSAGASYTVRAGDTLSAIAQRFGTHVASLADANDIDDPDLIYVGQPLTIPGGGGDAPAGRAPGATDSATHVVASGESLGSIAARYGLTVGELARANGITDPDLVMAGSLLRIAREAPPPPGRPQPATHRVATGETVSGIASRYGVSVRALVDASELADADRITVGETLRIPGASGRIWTCPWTSTSYVNDFGVAKPGGRYHEGIDVFAPGGSTIRAPVGGTVEPVTGSRAGRQFTLRGDDGYTYIGSHMATFGKTGRVEAGDALGTVGSSGNARGAPPHTHIEMHNGGTVNPYPTLQRYCG